MDAVVDTPSTTTTSAPSTSAPATTTSEASPATSASTTTERPSIRDALDVFNEAARQQGRKPRQRQMALTTEPSEPGTATTQPDGTVTQQQSPPTQPQGPIPLEDHKKILANTRAKERQAVEQEYAQRFQRSQVAEQWFQTAAADPASFAQRNFVDALRDPWMRQGMLQLAAQALQAYGGGSAGAPQGRPAMAEPPPPDFHDGAGNQFYSAKAQAARDQWLIERVRSEVLGQVQPSLQQVEQVQQERQFERTQQAVQRTMAGHLAEARTWPYFKEHEPDIKAALAHAPLTSGHPSDEALLLQRIYQRIVGPKLSSLEQARVLADLKSKANASSLNPSQASASPGIPKNVRAKDGGTFRAALQWAAAQQQGRG